jgi:hypothetical protein
VSTSPQLRAEIEAEIVERERRDGDDRLQEVQWHLLRGQLVAFEDPA